MSSKIDKSNSKDCSAAANLLPESQCGSVDNTWSDSYEPPLKSKGKSVKLKKSSKTENSKKLIRQGSKDSVVLVGYKNLKASYGDTSTKYKEEGPSNQEEEMDNLMGPSSSHLRTHFDSVFDSGAASAHSGNSVVQSVVDDNISAACQKGFFKLSTNFETENKPQAGTEAYSRCSKPLHKDEQIDHNGQKLQQQFAGLKQTEVKPSIKDRHQAETVLPCQTDINPNPRKVPEVTQTDICDLKPTVMDNIFERPVKESAQHSQSCLLSEHRKSDCIRPPDGVPSASSRLSDSGIESEPSSFTTQLVPGIQFCAGLGVAVSGASQSERPLLSPAQRHVHRSSAQKPGGAAEVLYPENTSSVSGVQSSLTSINSLPSDDECEDSSRVSSGAEVQCRKSSVLVQEQSLVFSGDAINLVCPLDNTADDSQLFKPAFLEVDPKVSSLSELGLEGASCSGNVKESHSEPQTACPSSNSATSSTDLVKRGMVENYFGSRSSTDVSEISPVETSAITLGIQAEQQVEEDEDEMEHEMIENGYYEEGDGYDFVNGVVDEDQGGVGDAVRQEMSLLFDQLAVGCLHETKDLSKAPLCSNIPSSSIGHTSGRPPCLSALHPFSLQWYECAPTHQMKA